MSRKHHGVLSLIWLLIAIGIGAFAVFQSSKLLSITYLGVSTALFMVVIYSYCAKCPCKLHSCGHVLPGKLTTLLPGRKEEKYNLLDYLGVVIPLLIVITFPQFWLTKHLPLLIFFWLLVVITMIEIRFSVCKGCDNNYCLLNNSTK